MKRMVKWGAIAALVLAGSLVVYAYARTLNKTEVEFLIHIDEALVQQSVFGESPTFAIWMEDPESGETYTVFATRRVATGDWEGKKDVPMALPLWSELNRAELLRESGKVQAVHDDVISTGATPLPGYFRSRVSITPGSRWICWIEMNLAGDFNDSYPQYDPQTRIEDEFSTGQPALLYRAEIEVLENKVVIPELQGMCLVSAEGKAEVSPLEGITTASSVFNEMSITVVRPKPRIIQKSTLEIPGDN